MMILKRDSQSKASRVTPRWPTECTYWDGAQWQESQDLIEIIGDHAVAQYGPSKVSFSGNLNAPGAIDLTTANGNRLHSQPLGLYYYDRASGKIVALAAVKDCTAALYPPNRLGYEDAMDNLSASVVYVYAKNGFEQNIRLEQRPATPEQVDRRQRHLLRSPKRYILA